MRFVKHRTMNGAVVVTLAISAVCRAATLYVPADYPTIQACIDAAVSGVDECVVAPGTYHETINFLGRAITVRSSDGADVTTIDATGIGGSVVTCSSGEGADTALDGFTITGGTGTDLFGGRGTYGGGMINYPASPTVVNCTFSENTANYGGGMCNNDSNTTVTNCTFSGNSGGNGGGMYNKRSNPMVTNCTFSGNTAGDGGGMYNYSGSPTVTDCAFSGNTALYDGGGTYNISSSPALSGCTFSGNTGRYGGGGVYNRSSAPTVTNCTFSGNTAGYGGGMANGASTLTVTNCFLWGDTPDEIANIGELIISFSDVQGGLPVGAADGGGNSNVDPMFVRPPNPGPDGTWNGVDDDYGDLRLRAGSPCIDAGDPAFVAQPGETDLDGHARVLCGRVDMGAYEFGIGDYDCDQVVDLADFSSWQACMIGPHDVRVLALAALTAPAVQSAIDNRQLAIGCEPFDFDGDG
ncbi:MAG: right-handed parallel beta-helix repeat-containing protein, partial [Phycisphaerales bacterium]|nr:right-handed parallel beta-helix repeat-containing protein [Phycisphaerales bacterium]